MRSIKLYDSIYPGCINYLFIFRNLKAVIVPAIALPVSLIASFLGLYIFWIINKYFCLIKFYFSYWNNH